MNKLTKKQMCLVMRNGIEILIDEDKTENFKKILLNTKEHKFIGIDENIINTADLSGLFSPLVMEEKIRRKRGEFKCAWGKWHVTEDDCNCRAEELRKKYMD